MATAEEGGATANIASSSYGGGGAGGKFRKKPLRRQATPYDRPPTALRGNNTTRSWLTKLVVDPASKLISYGANRFFASVFRKRLPAPPPPEPPEVNADVSDAIQAAVLNSHDGAQDPAGGDCSQPINSSSNNGISELEQLLKQKTFTKSEIVHLTELLQSRAVEMCPGDDQKSEDIASDFRRHQQFASSPLEGSRNGEIRSSAVMSTPMHTSKVFEDNIASPAELAKAYMGSRPSKVSPSLLGMRSQVGREDTVLLSNLPFTSKSPTISLTKKTSASLAAPENGFITPRSRGRVAIYNMARTPYSRFHPTSIKGSGNNSNGYAGPSMSSSSLSLVENNEKSQPMTLKRRSSVLDDEVGSVGPIRRIRQKANLLALSTHHTARGVGIGTHVQQNLQLIGEPSHKVSNSVGQNENESVPSTSRACVPSKSSEVAARILQHLETLTPKGKSSESKFMLENPLKLAPHMLSRQARRSMEDVDSSKLLPDVLDDHKLGNRTNANFPDARDSSSQKHGKVDQSDPKESDVPSDTWEPVMNKDSVVSLRASRHRTGDSVVKLGASQRPQNKRAFRMSAQEGSLEHDDDVHYNGLVSGPFSGKKGLMVDPLTENKLAPAEEPKLLKTRIQAEDQSPSGLTSRETTERSSPGAITVGERSSVTAFPASEEAMTTSRSTVLPLSVAAFHKPEEANNPPPLFSFSSKVADKFLSLPSESSKMAETKPESSSSLVNVFASTGSQVEIPESDKGFLLNPLKAGDMNGKSDIVPPAASNGAHVSGPLVSFTAASSHDTNQISTGGPLFTSSTTVASFVPIGTSTSATSSGSIFGMAAKPSSLAGPVFKLGASVDPSAAVSAAPTTNFSEVADLRTKAEIDPSFGSSSSSYSTVAALVATSSASITSGLGSSISYSTENNIQGALFASASKSLDSGAGTVLLGTSVQSVSSASLPSFTTNGTSSFGSSLSNSQVFNPNNTFGFSSSASSIDTSTVVPGSDPTSTIVKFGASSAAIPEGTAVGSSSVASPGIFGFGRSSLTNAVGSSSGVTPPIFSSGGTSSVSASVINTAGSFSSGASGIFDIGGNSTTLSSTVNNSVSSSGAPSIVFGSSWQSPKSSIFGSTFTSQPPSTGFLFSASSTSSAAPTNVAAPMVFNSSTGASSSSIFSFTTVSTSPPSLSAFGNSPITGFAASPVNNDEMNAEDSMAEDPVQSSAPSIPVFGQPSAAPSPPAFAFGSTVPSQPSPFMFNNQQNQAATQNPSPFQASGSLEFNAGGSFSLGSGGGDKSGRKIVKINRNKNRKK